MLSPEGLIFPSRRATPALRKGCSPPGKTGGLTWLLAVVANPRVSGLGPQSILEHTELFSEACARGKSIPGDTQPS